MTSGSKLIISAGDNYTLSCDDAMTMYGMKSTVIVGEGSDNTIITCDSSAGLAFIGMSNITIANITLKGCGAWRNSTTQNGTNNFTLKFQCSLYFLNCSDVIMYDVIVTDGPGTGVMMYNTLGTITIKNSQFIRNRVPTVNTNTIPGGGGIYIEFTYCLPNTTDFTTCSPTVQGNSNYFIDNCEFNGNVGTSIKENTTKYIFPIGPDHQQFGRGGGLSMHFKGYSVNNSVTITNCVIRDNVAVWGGGILVDLLDSAQNNHIVIEDVKFINNSIPVEAGTGGGAIRIHYYPQLIRPGNIFNITNCMFELNSAYFGGGISISTHREKGVLAATNGITLSHCIWRNNSANIGSAIDLSSYFDDPVGQLATPIFKNCSFIKNHNIHDNNVVLPIGLGALHSDGISFSIEGDNYFIENHDSALAVIHTIVEFKENASAVFADNQGYKGGAMSLLGNTWLSMHPNTTVLFERNSAGNSGGAIYYLSAGLRDVNSRKCFIRYYDYMIPPTEWNTHFTFINNTSLNPGHAIYCTTLRTCSWDNTSIVTSPEVLKKTFRWNNAFTYNDDNNDTIATDPAIANITMESLEIAPGQLYHLNLSVTDDIGISRKTVFFVHSTNKTTASVASTSTYISDNQVEVLGSPGQSFQLDFHTITTRTLSFRINTTLARCPPGFYFPTGTANSSQSECVCSVYDKDERYNHIPYCDETALQAFLQPQFWAGYIRNNSVLVTGRCPPGYCHAEGNKKLPLPIEASNEKLNELICSPNNREGILCGRCKPGYHIYINSKDYKCGKCTIKHSHVIQSLAKYVPLTIFLLTIILLDINLASGLLNTFVFFSQMLPSLDLYAGGQIPIHNAAKPFVEVYQFCYGLFNLEYFESLDSMPGWCTFSFHSALTGIFFGYIVAFCPLVIISIVWFIIFMSDYCVCANKRNVIGNVTNKLRNLYRRIKPNGISLSNSFFRGLVTFIVLSYTKFTLVTLTILTPAYLSGPGGKNYGVVANLDGTMEYFGHEHLTYAIPAIFVLVFIVLLPLVLFATYPFMCNWLGIPVHKMMPFFDTLSDAFKRNEHRLYYYFSLSYFFYRIVLVTIFTFVPEVQQRYVLQQVFTSIILMVHVIAQPYKERKHNIIDLCLLTLIPTVISISFFQLFRVTNSASVYQLAMAVQIILLYIPLICLAVVIAYKFYQWRRYNGYVHIDPPDDQSFEPPPAIMLNDQYQGGVDQPNHDNNL